MGYLGLFPDPRDHGPYCYLQPLAEYLNTMDLSWTAEGYFARAFSQKKNFRGPTPNIMDNSESRMPVLL